MARNTYDFDLEELVENYGVEFLMEHGEEQYPISMDEFDEYFDSPYNAVLSAFNGGRYGFKQDPFNPNDEYFFFNSYGNPVSLNKYEYDKYLEDLVMDYEDEFIDYCRSQGYIE